MKSAASPKATEERLEEIRKVAAEAAQVPAGVRPSAGSPQKREGESYYGLPALKPPVWTWEVPLYFFLGGIAGLSACIGFAAQLLHGAPELIRLCLWVGFLGAAICPVLLIADLGRPARFLNMLRVFKLQSAMSVGAWTLVAFSSTVGLAVICRELILAGYGNGFVLLIEWVAEVSGAASGLILASYTAVLLGVTAIPVWSENRTLLPAVFLAGGLGSAAAVLELLGFRLPATHLIGIVASAVETVVAITIELRWRYVDRPLREGTVGRVTRAGGVLAGPVSLLLRIFWAQNSGARQAAALCFIAGALITRYAWIAAGRVSSRDPQALFQIQ